MSPDDVRHGRRAGYIAGCRADCCREPHLRYQKRSTYRRHREGSQIIDASAVVERANWWRARGVSIGAICIAANLGDGTIAELLLGQRDVCLKTTTRAVLGLGWDDFPDNALCFAGITRARIHSMMAAGNSLGWIVEATPGLSLGGRWRVQEKVTVGLARNVLATYESAPLIGPSRKTQTQTRNRGHMPPMGWDDPGELAMPHDWRVPMARRGGGTVDRADLLAEYDAMGLGVTEACKRLGITRDGLEKWCVRKGEGDVLASLVARERKGRAA